MLNERVTLAIWLAVALLVVFHATMLIRYSVDFPFQDDFTQLLAVPSYFDHYGSLAGKISYVLELSVEHRIATLRLVSLVQAKLLGGLQFQWLILYGNVLCALAAGLVVHEADVWHRPWLALVGATLLTSPALYIAHYWATAAVQHLGLAFYAFAALYCATRSGTQWTIAGLAFAVAAACTAANGLLTFLTAVGVLVIAQRWRSALVWAIAAIAIFSVYFLGYEPPPGRAAPLETLRDPMRFLLGWISALGSIAGARMPSIVLGSILIVASVVVAWRVRTGACGPTALAWLLFPILSAAAIAAGRLPWGDEEVLNSRYRAYSALAVIVGTAAISQVLGRRRTMLLYVGLLPLIAAWAVHSWRANILSVADLFARQRLSAERFAGTGHGIYTYFPPQVFGDYILSRAIDRNDYFGPGSVRNPIRPTDSTAPSSSDSTSEFVSDMPIAEFGILSVRGRAPATAGAVIVWFAHESTYLRAELPTKRIYRRGLARDWSIFWGTLSTREFAPGRYRIGYAGTENSTGVVWSDHWVTINSTLQPTPR
jgi:hypothetical protein